MYGPKFRGWLASNASAYHGVLLTEVHQDDLSKAIRFLRKHGLIATGATVCVVSEDMADPSLCEEGPTMTLKVADGGLSFCNLYCQFDFSWAKAHGIQ